MPKALVEISRRSDDDINSQEISDKVKTFTFLFCHKNFVNL